MQHERYVGFEIKALSNLLRRRLMSTAEHPQGMLTEIEGVLIGYLCHNKKQEIYQKDLEQIFCIRSSHGLPPAEAAGGRGADPAVHGRKGRPDEVHHRDCAGSGAE